MSGMAVALTLVLLASDAHDSTSATREALLSQPERPDPAGKAAWEARLALIDSKLAEVKDLRADFVQRKKTALLKKPIESRGTIISKGARVLWQTREPRPTGMLVNETEVRVYYPDDKLVEVFPLGTGFRDATGGPLPRLDQLRERFDFFELDAKELSDAPDRSHLVAMHLTPKADELKEHIAWVRVLIDDSIPCANRIIVADPDGDETEMRFSHVRINTDVTDAQVELDLPEGVRVSRPLSGGDPPGEPPAGSAPPRDDPPPARGG